MSVYPPFLLQLLASAVAVTAIVGLAAWLGVPRAVGGLTEEGVRALLADEHPELPVERVCMAPDARSAVIVSGQQTLSVRRVGDADVVDIVRAAAA